MTDTQTVIREMLTENTGSHFLDSGGAYGRNWSRNQGRKLSREPESTVEFQIDTFHGKPEPCIIISHNLYHWLSEKLGDYMEAETGEFWKWAESGENADRGWPGLMELWAEQHSQAGDSIGCVNSYNGEDCLSQVIQWAGWYDHDTRRAFVLLQIHGGCDVRGGYTKPRMFAVDDYGDLANNARATLYCPHCHHAWDTDDAGSHFQAVGDHCELDEYPLSTDPAWKGAGLLVVIDGLGFCPYCGTELKAGA